MNTSIFVPFFILSGSFAWNLGDILQPPSENPDVQVLSESDFETFVTSPDTVSAVMFVSPWCFICGPLQTFWGETAKMVTGNTELEAGIKKIQFGVIDVLKNPKIAETHNIHAFPTLKLFIDQEVFSYTHESAQIPMSASLLVNWVNKHTKRRNVINSESQLKDFLKENHLVAVALLDETEASLKAKEQLAHSALHFEDVFFIEIYSQDLKIKFSQLVNKPLVTAAPSILMVYDHDDKYAQYDGPFTQASIDAFIKGRRLLTVNTFQPGTIEYILDAGLPMLFLVNPASDDEQEARATLSQVASQYLGKLVAVTLSTIQPWEQKLTELLDVQDTNVPVVRILTQRSENLHDHDPVSQSNSIIKHGIKFKPSEDSPSLSQSFLKTFIDQFLAGSLPPYVRSEPEPDDPKDSFTPGSILVNAVASNFPKLVLDDTKRDVLVVYHAPWCGFCRKLMPTLRELGEKLSHTGKFLKLVKIDATRNEVPGVAVSGYPTIMLYNAVQERVDIDRRPAVQYQGDRSVEDLVKFLHANAINQFPDLKPPGDSATIDDNAFYSFEEL